MKSALQIREHFNKFNDNDKITVKDIKQDLDNYIDWLKNQPASDVGIEAVKVFVSKMIGFDHFSDYDIRFIEQRLCDYIASK